MKAAPVKTMHLSEMLLKARLHGTHDGFRTRRGFSQDDAVKIVVDMGKASNADCVLEDPVAHRGCC